MRGRIEKLHGLKWRKKETFNGIFLSLFVLRCLYFLFIAVMIEVLAQVPCMVGRYGLGFYGIPIQGINVLSLFGVPFFTFCLSHRVGSCCHGLNALIVFCGDVRHLYGTI